jgi:hypothetical protein
MTKKSKPAPNVDAFLASLEHPQKDEVIAKQAAFEALVRSWIAAL